VSSHSWQRDVLVKV